MVLCLYNSFQDSHSDHMGNKDMKVNLNKEAIERNNNICVFTNVKM